MKNFIYRLSLLFICAALAAPAALALSTDRDQPAQITADDIEFDFNTGIRTYTGNVRIVQGSLRITADKLVANYDKDGVLLNATAWGNLATFKQRQNDKDADTIGRGREIVVDEIANTLTLVTTASLTQGANTATGARIVYDMATDKLKIQGGGGAAQINTAGKDGSTLPPTPPPTNTAAVDPRPAAAPAAAVAAAAAPAIVSDQDESDGESDTCEGSECDEAVLKAALPGVDVSVSPSGRSRVIIHPKSDPAPTTTARAEDAAQVAQEKLAEAIESDSEAVEAVKEELKDAIDAAGNPDISD